MPAPTMQQYLKSLKSLTGLLVSAGVLVPALAYFTILSPPLLQESSLFTAAIAVATLLAVFQYRFRNEHLTAREGFSPLSRRAVHLLLGALATFIGYILLLRISTVVDPQGQQRWQIGFYKLQWSLTAAGREKAPELPIEDWMLSGAYFRDGGPEVLWTPFSIYLAGILLILLFTTTFVLWTAGWGLLAKQHAYASQREAHARRNARRKAANQAQRGDGVPTTRRRARRAPSPPPPLPDSGTP